MRFPTFGLLGATALLASALASTNAQAGGTEPITTQVSHADLDLATPEGAAALDARLKRAARKVCVQHGQSLHELAHERKCRRAALAQASADAEAAVAHARMKQ